MTYKSRTHEKVAFNDSWLTEERFRLWVKKGRDCSKAVRSSCKNAVIDVRKIGVRALCLYAKGTRHQESGIIIPLLRCFSKEIKQVFCPLSVAQQKLMIGKLI